jgi:hypothetical protein
MYLSAFYRGSYRTTISMAKHENKLSTQVVDSIFNATKGDFIHNIAGYTL